MTRARHALVACVLASATVSCALVSGLSSLDVDETSDASVPDSTTLDVSPPDVVIDARSDADAAGPLDAGIDAVADGPRDVGPDVVPSIQCGASPCPLTSTCCHKLFPQSFTCSSDAGNCQYVVSCDALSCKPGEVCCVTGFGGLGTSTSCVTTCNSPNVRLCVPNNGPACPNGTTCLPSDGGFVPYYLCK